MSIPPVLRSSFAAKRSELAQLHPGLRMGAGFYAGIAVVALVRPGIVPAVFGGAASTASARTEIRAVYGGMPLALAALCLHPASAPTVAGLTVAMAAGRAAGVKLEGEANAATRLSLAFELATAGALLAGARWGRAKP